MNQPILYLFLLLLLGATACQENKSESKNKATATAGESSGYSIKAKLDGVTPGESVYLIAVSGEEFFLEDSTTINKNGQAIFDIKNTIQPGMYQLSYGKERLLYLIYNFENIDIETISINEEEDSIAIKESLENQLFYNFTNNYSQSEYRKAFLLQMLANSPKDSKDYEDAVHAFNIVQQEQQAYLQGLKEEHPNAYTVRYALFNQSPEVDPTLGEREKMAHIKKHFFEHLNFKDTVLLNSDLVPKTVINYLSLYALPEGSPAEQEAAFKIATDELLGKAKVNPKMYNYILEYLLNGFYGLGFEGAMMYIADNYLLAEGCESPDKEDYLKNKLANLKNFKVGNIVPDIDLVNAEQTSLYGIDTPYKIVFFWASWCEHCEELMPVVKDLYQAQNEAKQFEVIAVSIDEEATEWLKARKEGGYDIWINSCDYKGWKGKAANDYYVYGTPMVFFLNKEHKIVGRPTNEAELKQLFKDNSLL